jgi:hypothetical protein
LLHKIQRVQRIQVKIGAIILTIPFPLMAGFSGESFDAIASPLLLLIFVTSFNLMLADSLIFEKSVTVKNHFAFALLTTAFYLLSPFLVFLTISLSAVLLIIVGKKLTVKQLGFSLLFLHVLFSAEYLFFF